MKKIPRILAETATVCALLVSLGLNAIQAIGSGGVPHDQLPFEDALPIGEKADAAPREPAGSPDALSARDREYSAAELAALFGWKPAPAPKAAEHNEIPEPDPQAVPREPVPAAWMTLVGSIIGDGGSRVFFLKDSRRKLVMRVVEGEENDGYRALVADGKTFLLEREGELYKVDVK